MNKNEKIKKTERKIFFFMTIAVLLYGIFIKVADGWKVLMN